MMAPAHTAPGDRTTWRSTNIRSTHVADGLGLTAASLRQYLHLHRDAVPAPAVSRRGQETEWVLGEIFDHVLANRPGSIPDIPRLYPRTPSVAQAQFVGAEIINGVPVHLWLPGDGGGAIAVVYVKRSPQLWNSAADLFERLSTYTLVAVVGPHLTDPLTGLPEVFIHERDSTQFAAALNAQNVAGLTTYQARWADIAHLLQRPVPWWPSTLLTPELVVSWRPGAPPTLVLPRDPGTGDSPERLLRLANTIHADSAAEAVRTMARIAATVYGAPAQADIAKVHHRPGITVAAQPDLPTTESAAALTASEIDIVLGSEAPVAAVADTAYMLADLRLLAPVWTETHHIRIAALGPFGARWFDRLLPAPDQHRDTTGWHLLVRNAPPSCDTATLRPMFDPLLPSLWIAASDTEVLYSVGDSTPGALTLASVDLTGAEDGVVFWRDTSSPHGQVWPMPEVTGNGYSVGYNGAGPWALARALEKLTRAGNTALVRPTRAGTADLDDLDNTLTRTPCPTLLDLARDGDAVIVTSHAEPASSTTHPTENTSVW
ncbi:hypothetical protein [Rhodococcus baikonurensis]|uniref:Uncharacterized protein n=1 Tax=Rhodococcus baikonurensis TaxID=172041 RepID=A0ABV5XS39_9NOCA